MISEIRPGWPAMAAGIILAVGLGFGIARWTASAPPPPAPKPAPSGPAILKIEAREIAAAGIVVEPVADGNLSAEILAPATTAAQPSGVAALTAHAEGIISRLNKRLGDPVKAGEVLAIVDSKDAAQIAFDRASAQARAVLARRIADGLRGQILGGKWTQGTQLPSTDKLAATWKTSYGTIHNALQSLVKEGWIERIDGSGTFVAHFENRFECVVFTTSRRHDAEHASAPGVRCPNSVRARRRV